jgi:hypothetical protein
MEDRAILECSNNETRGGTSNFDGASIITVLQRFGCRIDDAPGPHYAGYETTSPSHWLLFPEPIGLLPPEIIR